MKFELMQNSPSYQFTYKIVLITKEIIYSPEIMFITKTKEIDCQTVMEFKSLEGQFINQ